MTQISPMPRARSPYTIFAKSNLTACPENKGPRANDPIAHFEMPVIPISVASWFARNTHLTTNKVKLACKNPIIDSDNNFDHRNH